MRFLRADGASWIEKSGSSLELAREAAVLEWCSGSLPVPRVLAYKPGSITMSVMPGVSLLEAPMEEAMQAMIRALHLIHSIPVGGCPFDAGWELRLSEGEANIRAGLIDESDFDEDNVGRSPSDILAELRSMPPLPETCCFTHGDACLPNFLTHCGELTGIIDVGRAGVTHPAQDWALALRSFRANFGSAGERLLRQHLPPDSQNEELLRRFRLLDELF